MGNYITIPYPGKYFSWLLDKEDLASETDLFSSTEVNGKGLKFLKEYFERDTTVFGIQYDTEDYPLPILSYNKETNKFTQINKEKKDPNTIYYCSEETLLTKKLIEEMIGKAPWGLTWNSLKTLKLSVSTGNSKKNAYLSGVGSLHCKWFVEHASDK